MESYKKIPELLLNDLTEVKNWLIKIGINVEGTRFDEIYNNLALFVEFKEKCSIKCFIDRYGFESYLYTAIDSVSFIDIYKAFSSLKGSIPVKKIRESLNGPFLPREEIPGDANVNSRNYFFELELASKLILKGIKVEGFDDIIFNFELHKFHIECKRLISGKRVPENIQIAYDQLSKKMSNSNERGIIAFCFDKVFNLDDKIYTAKNFQDISSQLNQVGNRFRVKYSDYWNKLLNIVTAV